MNKKQKKEVREEVKEYAKSIADRVLGFCVGLGFLISGIICWTYVIENNILEWTGLSLFIGGFAYLLFR